MSAKEQIAAVITEHWIRAIRRAGVPLVVVETSDAATAVTVAVAALNGKADEVPVMQWDIVRALVGVNDRGREVAAEIAPDGPIQTGNPTEMLSLLAVRAPVESLVFMHAAHRFVPNESVCQAVWNLRDVFKARGSTLVLLCPAGGSVVPAEITHDVVVVTEPLPVAAEIRGIVDSIMEDSGVAKAGEEQSGMIVDTLSGLSAFACEQTLALSLSPAGVDMDGLWERKRKTIEQTPGLSVWRGGETFADIGGCDNVKSFLTRLMTGENAPRAVAFIDEIEKAMGGSGTDTSGVSQDQLRTLLTYMQDKDATGMIFVGPPGAAKSAVAKAAGTAAGIPTVAVDLGGMKGSLVGESERKLRAALAVVDAVSQGRTLFIATCNSLAVLPPELKRRFTLGTYFFDLPTAEERAMIWPVWLGKYSLVAGAGIAGAVAVAGEIPNDEGWTGAEIRQCCNIAWRLRCSLVEAAAYVVPVAKAAADKIEQLRVGASGKFISAGKPGLYRYVAGESGAVAGAVAGKIGRKMSVGGAGAGNSN